MALKKSALYSSLWKSCDELRGSMDASQYKNYVLVLLFVKYVTDKYAGRTDALLEVPNGGSFHDMVLAMGQKDIGDRLNKIISKLAEANGLSGVLDVPEADFNDDNKLGSGQEMVDRLTELVAIFNKPELNFTQNRADGDDLLGDAYEYLMRHFATESGKSKGQFYTPSEVSRVIAKIVGIDRNTKPDQRLYDPTCGSGSLLLKAADEALPTKMTIYGQEMDNATYALARMNMILHGHDGADLVKGNTLATPATWGEPVNQLKQHDFIVANPPFSTKSWMNGLTPDADPYSRFTGFGVPPAKNGDYAFLLHIVRSLKGNGKAVVVLPHGVLFRGNAEGVIRKNLVQRGYLKGIIGLPANLFYGTGIPACLLVLDKEGAGNRTHIFMVDASRGYLKDGNKNRLREQDQHRIVDVWRRQEDEAHFARLVPRTEIERNDYNLNLPRYVEGPPTQDHHDIEAHLRGGLPAADLEALAAYWDVYPTLRDVLTEPGDRPGYFRLRVAPDDIRPTIFEHPEFRAFRQRVEETFGTWVEGAEPLLRGIAPDTKPKALLETLSESLLATFGPVHLLDGYDVYQRLMNYWTATLQDDVYQVVADGWDARPYRPLVGKKQRPGQWTSDLVPRELLISRYLTAEQQAAETAAEAAAEATRAREELEEEYTAEEGILSELEYTNPTQLAAVKARLRELTKGAKDNGPAPKRGRKAKNELLGLFDEVGPGLASTSPPDPLSRGEGEPVLLQAAEPAAPFQSSGSPLSTGEGGRGGEVNGAAEELAALRALEAALAHEAAAKKALTEAQTHLEAQIGPSYERLTPDAARDLQVARYPAPRRGPGAQPPLAGPGKAPRRAGHPLRHAPAPAGSRRGRPHPAGANPFAGNGLFVEVRKKDAMSKASDKKRKIFKLFSQNLEWVKQHPDISFHPDFSNGYICPLCFDVFFEKDLFNTVKNPLTIEDIPPVSLGGKPLALTCKNCNSKSGHELDIHLLNRLLELDSHGFLPNSKIKASFELNENTVNGTFEIDEKGVAKLNLQTKRSNPMQAEHFMEDMFPPRTIYSPLFYPEKLFDDINRYESPTFHLKFNEVSNERRAQVALLRIGYLIAFATLGNGFCINGNLYKVREQILKPDENILPKVFWVNRDFPEETEGINIVTLPKELRCFLVIFKLKTPSQSRQFSVVLPGPSDPGLQVYDFLNQERSGDTLGWMEHLNTRDLLRHKDHAFTSHWYWQKFTKDSYQPRIRPALDDLKRDS